MVNRTVTQDHFKRDPNNWIREKLVALNLIERPLCLFRFQNDFEYSLLTEKQAIAMRIRRRLEYNQALVRIILRPRIEEMSHNGAVSSLTFMGAPQMVQLLYQSLARGSYDIFLY